MRRYARLWSNLAGRRGPGYPVDGGSHGWRYGKMRTVAMFAAALVVLAAVWFAGCGGGSSEDRESSAAPGTGETATIEATDAESGEVSTISVTGSGEESTITAVKEDGTESVSTGGAKIPADFPEDFPRYEGWEVTSVINTNQEGKKGFVIMATTADSADKVVAAFEKALGEKGYRTTAKMTVPQGANIVVEKDKIAAVVTIGAAQGKTVINVTLAIGQ